MAAPLLGYVLLEDKLITILREYDREARVERSLEPEWLVIEALFNLIHETKTSNTSGSYILVGGVSSLINKSLVFRGEDVRVTARGVGSVLKSLGIRTQRLGRLGRGLTLTSLMKGKIHELARRFGFDRTDIATLSGLESGYGGSSCVLCEQAGLSGKLRFVDLHALRSQEFLGHNRSRPPEQAVEVCAESQATLNVDNEHFA